MRRWKGQRTPIHGNDADWLQCFCEQGLDLFGGSADHGVVIENQNRSLERPWMLFDEHKDLVIGNFAFWVPSFFAGFLGPKQGLGPTFNTFCDSFEAGQRQGFVEIEDGFVIDVVCFEDLLCFTAFAATRVVIQDGFLRHRVRWMGHCVFSVRPANFWPRVPTVGVAPPGPFHPGPATHDKEGHG